MSQLTTISGTVSGVRLDTIVAVNTTVSVTEATAYTPATSSTSSQTLKSAKMNFRIDNRPVHMPVDINIANGDQVTAAGIQKGEFEALAINDHTTKTMYWVPKPSIVTEIAHIVTGVIWLMFHVTGWLWIGWGGFSLMNKNKKIKLIKDASVMVEKAQRP